MEEKQLEKLKRAIIVAAGEGRRLRPVTLDTPKPLVTVNGTRLIDTSIKALKHHGIHEIYIVTGYKSEQFREVYKEDPEIIILENEHYLEGNNITSLYVAREYLPGAFVLEGDLIISNENIFDPQIVKSGYFATWMDDAPEWALKLTDGTISYYNIGGGKESYRLWGVSMWTEHDGRILSEMVRAQIEEVRDWNIYWDELALSQSGITLDLGIREIGPDDITEIDTFEELKEIDPAYEAYQMQR